jgi:hypothetical protein
MSCTCDARKPSPAAFTPEARAKAARVRLAKAIQSAEWRYSDKRHAYRAGYKVGYTRAWRAWKARYELLKRRVGAA